ncbi:DUF3820 family protein [Joostella atrarenae]|uniref:DUF3820 family protein n=1 Tax=Joostella atrarenae TaxID=679257 RepID=A0ABS9J421_9FLAO|nr:DUF3820 family protein [Joostella atrarenae]MCF8715181.1 DUF3820 family protein [Joostella atrarenae]
MDLDQNREFLVKLAHAKMPFGKYKDRYLIDIPEPYYVWFRQKGFPNGKLGMQLEAMYEIKVNGLEELIYKIRKVR